MYQTEWQQIKFTDFADLSFTKLADLEFYQAFYQEFFKRYCRWNQLPKDWLDQKHQCGKFIFSLVRGGDKILSVGCGLGAMEHYMCSQKPGLDLSIHEMTRMAWCWIEREFPENKKFIGLIPNCLSKGLSFDLIYLSAVDYVLNDNELVDLLSVIRTSLLQNKGRCLIISASFDAKNSQRNLLRLCKDYMGEVLDALSFRPRGQFWGWARTRMEYQNLMKQAGFCNIEDGFINPDEQKHYWILGY